METPFPPRKPVIKRAAAQRWRHGSSEGMVNGVKWEVLLSMVIIRLHWRNLEFESSTLRVSTVRLPQAGHCDVQVNGVWMTCFWWPTPACCTLWVLSPSSPNLCRVCVCVCLWVCSCGWGKARGRGCVWTARVPANHSSNFGYQHCCVLNTHLMRTEEGTRMKGFLPPWSSQFRGRGGH